EVERAKVFMERVLEAAQLGQALGERHLAALEAQAEAFAAGVLALLAAARRLAAPRAGAPADALLLGSCALRRAQFVEFHSLLASCVLLVRALAPDLVARALGRLPGLALDGDQEVDLGQH